MVFHAGFWHTANPQELNVKSFFPKCTNHFVIYESNGITKTPKSYMYLNKWEYSLQKRMCSILEGQLQYIC